MSGQKLSSEELKAALENLFERMETKGLITPEMRENKTKIIENAMSALQDPKNGIELTHADMSNTLIHNKLMSTVMCAYMDSKQLTDLSTLALKGENKYKIDAEQNKLTEKLLELNPEKLKRLTPGEMDKFEKQFIENFKDNLKENLEEKTGKSCELPKEADDQLDKLLSATLRSLYGGDDPRIAGEVVGPVIGTIYGNLFGFTNQSQANPTSYAAMTESATYNPSKPDYNSLESIIGNTLQATSNILNKDMSLSPK